MLLLGIVGFLVACAAIGLAITSAAFSQRHWRHLIEQGDRPTLLAAVEEALVTFRGMRPTRGIAPADWRALQSAALIAADRDRCRVSLVVEPDVRVIGGTERREVGPAETVARRVAVRMAERLFYEIPLAHFETVQVDVYTEYRSPEGRLDSECLLTTQVGRFAAAQTDWDDEEPAAILATWDTRERAPGQPIDPDEDAVIGPEEFRGDEDTATKDGIP